MTTVFLHGFWGQPSDWNDVLSRLPVSCDVWIPDLYEAGPLPPHNISQWVEHFLEAIDQRAGEVQVVGYSMGGRLLLNALMREPGRFQRALVLSAYPVLKGEEKAERTAWGQSWRKRFLEDPWSEL